MPYLLETAEGQYVCDVSLSMDREGEVATSAAFAHVSPTLQAAISMHELVGIRGVRTALVGVGKEPLPLPLGTELVTWPVGLFEATADLHDRVFT